jgi:sterol desaturase/sphingolipid hydroxylase (fatty acid hydroxylase superfamily)
MAILGFDPNVVGTVLILNIFYQLWIHATWIPKLGPLEYVLNTPSHHRVHHARQVEYLDANFGGTLIIFDRLFGTFKEERVDLPCDYGLVKKITSYKMLARSGEITEP